MSFLQREIIPTGYIAIQPKRLNSVSSIAISPSTVNNTPPQPPVKRAIINPFEQLYVTPFLKMFDAEEREEEAQKQQQQQQQQKEYKSTYDLVLNDLMNSKIGKRLLYGLDRTFNHTAESFVDLVTLPAKMFPQNSTETAKFLKTEIARDDELIPTSSTTDVDENPANTLSNERAEKIRNFGLKTAGLPTTFIRQLSRRIKKDSDDVDVSSFLQGLNQEEENERLLQSKNKTNEASQQIQGLIRSKNVEKGYKERMDATKFIQAQIRQKNILMPMKRIRDDVQIPTYEPSEKRIQLTTPELYTTKERDDLATKKEEERRRKIKVFEKAQHDADEKRFEYALSLALTDKKDDLEKYIRYVYPDITLTELSKLLFQIYVHKTNPFHEYSAYVNDHHMLQTTRSGKQYRYARDGKVKWEKK